jgi:hypothetical protein
MTTEHAFRILVWNQRCNTNAAMQRWLQYNAAMNGCNTRCNANAAMQRCNTTLQCNAAMQTLQCNAAMQRCNTTLQYNAVN